MSPREDLTPEEKLLRLIRRPKKEAHKYNPSLPPNKKNIEASTSKDRGDKRSDKKTDFSPTRKLIFSGVTSLNFALLNRAIMLGTVVIVALFVLDLYYNQPQISRSLFYKKGPATTSLIENKLKPFSYYQQEISQRKLFKVSQVSNKQKQFVPAGPTFQELVKNFALLGIVSGDSPQAIIEDRKFRKTYFLYSGDYINEIKIKEIHSDRVILEYNSEHLNLFL